MDYVIYQIFWVIKHLLRVKLLIFLFTIYINSSSEINPSSFKSYILNNILTFIYSELLQNLLMPKIKSLKRREFLSEEELNT